MFENILKLTFLASTVVLSTFLGWILEYNEIKVFLYVIILLTIIFVFLFGLYYAKSNVKKIRLVSIILLNFLAYFLGFGLYKEGYFNISEWIIQSYNEVKAIKVIYVSKKILENKQDKYKEFKEKKFKEIITKLNFYDKSFNYTILVKFQNDIFSINLKDGLKSFKVFYGNNEKLYPLPFIKDDYFLAFENNKLMKINYFGNKKWIQFIKGKKNILHHWGDVFESKIYVPGRNFHNIPNKISKNFTPYFKHCNKKNSIYDTIEIFDEKTGKHINSIQIMPLFINVKDLYLYIRNCVDPFHLNDVRIIKKEKHAKFFKGGKVGDLLISMRNIHTIALLDKDTHMIKWYAYGDFTHQHSPRITDKGTILIFDNSSSKPKNGTSKIIEIKIDTKKIVGSYEGYGDIFLESQINGRIQLLKNRIFIQESDNGRLLELICDNINNISKECKQKIILEFKKEYIPFLSGNMYIADIITD